MSHRLVQTMEQAWRQAEDGDRSHLLSLARALEGIYPFLTVKPPAGPDGTMPMVVVQVTTRCNQACPFCQAPDPGAMVDPPLESLVRALDRVASALPGARVVLTGGEPCLRPDLQELLEYPLRLDRVAEVELQTNAVAIGRHPDRYSFAPSPRLTFVVGLHALSDEVYDACTATRGLLPLAIEGVRSLLTTGHTVELNCVVSRLNVDHLAKFVERVAELFPSTDRPGVHFSIMGIPEHRDATELQIPYRHLLEAVDLAVERAADTQVELRVALSAGHAAVPACLLDEHAPDQSRPRVTYRHEGLSGDAERWWVHGPACRTCCLEQSCLGVSRAYAARFGLDDLRPLTPTEDGPEEDE